MRKKSLEYRAYHHRSTGYTSRFMVVEVEIPTDDPPTVCSTPQCIQVVVNVHRRFSNGDFPCYVMPRLNTLHPEHPAMYIDRLPGSILVNRVVSYRLSREEYIAEADSAISKNFYNNLL